MLAEYEDLNRDLPRETRRQLAVFVLATKTGTEALEELFGRPLGQTPIRHRSWLWYTAMTTSGLSGYWPTFRDKKNSGVCLHRCIKWLQDQASLDQWEVLSRRFGIPAFKKGNSLNPYWWKDYPDRQPTTLWTAGGCWDRRNGFTQIILLGNHLDRDHSYSQVTRALNEADTRLLEKEVHNIVDPEEELHPQAVRHAVRYIRTRIPDLLGYKRPTTSWKNASWFFQEPVPFKDGAGFMDWRSRARYPMKRTAESGGTQFIDWLPPLEDQ